MNKTIINRNFRIVIYGTVKRTAVGVEGLVNFAGYDNATKAVLRAFNSKADKITIKLRRGLRIDFYSK